MDDKKDELDDNKIQVNINNSSNDEPTEQVTDEPEENIESAESAEEDVSAEGIDKVESTEVLETIDEPELPVLEPDTTSTASETDTAAAFGAKSAEKSKKKLFAGLAVIVLVTAACLGTWMLLKDETGKTAKTTKTTEVANLMGAEISVIDGTAKVSTDNVAWDVLKVGDNVSEGSYYKTDAGSRLIIALDDGSALRMNSNSTVKLDSLEANDIVVTTVAGELYSRLVKSDRSFSVNVADEIYTALGTAYVTVNTDDTKGVEVYESKVKLAEKDIEVPQGKYYYTDAKDAKKEEKVGTISTTTVKKDSFVVWNYNLDKKNPDFKKDLGYLVKIDEKTEEKEDEPSEPEETSSLTVSGVKYSTGVKLSWALTDLTAPKGFKLLKSSYAYPVFGKEGTSATYISDPNARSYAWTIKDGGTYHFRVCIYTGSGCSSYSNDITVTAPKYQDSSEAPTGSVSLQDKGGGNVKWVLNGTAPGGYKLVWSTSPSPTYPGDSGNYYSTGTTTGSIDEDNGTFYVRVCLYKSGYGCSIYSNELTITLP